MTNRDPVSTEKQQRNTIRIAVISAVFTGLIIVYFMVTSLATQLATGIFSEAALASVILAAALLALWLARRGRVVAGAWTLIAAFLYALTGSVITVSGLGILFGVLTLVLTFGIASNTLPASQIKRAAALSLSLSLAFVLLDGFDLFPRTPALMRADVWVITIGMLFVYGFFVIRQFNDYTFNIKLAIAFGVVSLVSLIGLAMVATITVRSQLENQINERYIAQTNNVAQIVDAFMEARISQIIAMAVTDVLKEELEKRNESYVGDETAILAEIKALDERWIQADDDDPLIQSIITAKRDNPAAFQLADFLDAFPDQTEIFVTDRYGATVGATGRLSDYYQADEAWWQAAYREGEGAIYVSHPEFDESAGVKAVLIAIPVVSEETGEVLGVIRSTLTLEDLELRLENVNVGEGGRVGLLHDTGQIIFALGADGGAALTIPAQVQDRLSDKEAQTIIIRDENQVSTLWGYAPVNSVVDVANDVMEEEELLISQSVANLNWSVVIKPDVRQALSPVDELRQNIQLFTVLILALTGAAAFVVARLLSRPILALTAAAEEMRRGNLRVALPPAGRDEIGRLSDAMGQMASRLRGMIGSLEQRVAERTNDLALAAEVGRRVSQIRALDELLAEAVELIRSRFSLYHAQIYLIDDEELILRASTGQAGEELLAREHRLAISEESINGAAADSRESVIVLDTAVDPFFQPNPLLPDTRSEMAIPLIAAGQVVGVLDLQSDESGTFSEETLPAFEALAGQLAVAIENANLFTVRAQAESALRESQQKYMDLVEGLPLGIYRNTPGAQGEMLEANTAMVNIFEADSKDAFLAISVADTYKDPKQRQEFSNRLLEQGIVENVELEMVTQKGRAFWGAVTAVKKEDASGGIYYDGFVQDITARKQAETLLNKRARELALLNELGQKTEETPPIPEYLAWAAQRIPPAMEYSECCLVAITYQDQVYGRARAIDLSRQIVEGLRIGGERVGRIYIAYTEDFPFEDSDSALIGGIGRRVSSYIENQQLLAQVQTHVDKLQIVSDVSTTAAVTLDTQELLQNVADRTKAGFDLYHAHIYLLNDLKTELILAAGADAVGRQMVADGQRISMSKRKSLVVRAAKTRQGVVVNDVQADTGFLPNPMLPETRAEVAVPMIAGERVLGVLDVQAAAVNAFSDEDVPVFTTLAAQVAAALQNAGQHEQTQSALDELSALQRAMTREGWQAFMLNRERPVQGFVADQKAIRPIVRNGGQETAVDAVAGVETLMKDETAVITPMRLYGETIGGLGARDPSGKPLDEEQRAILDAISQQVAEALERARLTEQTEMALAETEEQARRRARLNQLSADLTRTQELEKIYDIVTSAALDMVGGNRTTLTLLSDDQQTVTVLVAHGDVAKVPLNTPLPTDAVVRGVIENRAATLLNDPVGKGGRGGVVSSIVAPLLVGGRVIGTLNISSKQYNYYDKADRDLILQLANILSSVVENRQLFTQMQERAEELAIINQVAETVSQHMEPELLLKAVYEQIQRVMPVDAYHVGLLDVENSVLNYPVMFEDGEWLDSPPVPLNPNSNSYKVLQTGEPVILNLTAEDKEALTQAGATIGDTAKPMTSSSAFLPLFLGTKAAGVLAVHSYKDNAYDQADVALLTGIANHVALALENARLFGQTEEALAQTEALYAASAELNAAQAYHDILSTLKQYTILGEGAQNISINLFDRPWTKKATPAWIEVIARLGELSMKSAARRYQVSDFKAAKLIYKTPGPLIIEDVANDKRIDKNTRNLFAKQFGAASAIFVPLDYGGERVGYINAIYQELKTFPEDEVRRLVSLTGQAAVSVQNIRLLDQVRDALAEARRQSEELALINRVVSSVAATLDVSESLQIVATELAQAVNVDEVAIALMNEGGDSLTVVAENYNPEEANSSLGYVIPVAGNALTQKVLDTRQPLTVLDAQTNPLTEPVHDRMRMRGVQTLHLFPMIAGNTIIGMVGIDILEEGKILTDQELQLAQTLVYQAATAVQNARLFAESEEHAEELSILNEMGRALTTKLDLESILMDTHRYITRLLDINDMYIALYDEAADEVDIKIFGSGEDIAPEALRRRMGNGITELVLRTRQPLLIKDNIEQAAQEYGFDLIGRSASSWLGVPMTVGDKVLGIVAVQDFDQAYAFNEHQQDLLLALSSQVAIAIENVRLFDLEQARAKRERLLREIAEQVRRSTNVETVLKTAVEEVGRALGRRAYVVLDEVNGES